MSHKPVHLIFYLTTLREPAEVAGLCNVLKYKVDTFYSSLMQKPTPEQNKGASGDWVPDSIVHLS